jgi:hypothetical protein
MTDNSGEKYERAKSHYVDEKIWNKIPEEEKQKILDKDKQIALDSFVDVRVNVHD